MRLRDLEMALQSLKRFDVYDKSTFKLESYPTPANIAAAILFSAEMDHGDITGTLQQQYYSLRRWTMVI
ncbi:MAG: hypothetical protein ACXAEF_15905 [Candidatus Thorarchaeota archaeon]|jgi:predicted RNA methylase